METVLGICSLIFFGISLMFWLYVRSIKRWVSDRTKEMNRAIDITHSRVNSAHSHLDQLDSELKSVSGKVLSMTDKIHDIHDKIVRTDSR